MRSAGLKDIFLIYTPIWYIIAAIGGLFLYKEGDKVLAGLVWGIILASIPIWTVWLVKLLEES